ncbi:MAG: hypothetical protein NZ811_02065 [Gammaproteobacteria bacterium]|nr:hypothetical protein [Gammaproteobacteria bacterium]
MALESATYINGLVDTNPTGTDVRSQGDDHLRLLKSTIKSTFPNVTGAVTATQDELNIIDGVTATTTQLNFVDATSSIQTQIDTKQATVVLGSNGYGTRTVSATEPSSPAEGDIWYEI